MVAPSSLPNLRNVDMSPYILRVDEMMKSDSASAELQRVLEEFNTQYQGIGTRLQNYRDAKESAKSREKKGGLLYKIVTGAVFVAGLITAAASIVENATQENKNKKIKFVGMPTVVGATVIAVILFAVTYFYNLNQLKRIRVDNQSSERLLLKEERFRLGKLIEFLTALQQMQRLLKNLQDAQRFQETQTFRDLIFRWNQLADIVKQHLTEGEIISFMIRQLKEDHPLRLQFNQIFSARESMLILPEPRASTDHEVIELVSPEQLGEKIAGNDGTTQEVLQRLTREERVFMRAWNALQVSIGRSLDSLSNGRVLIDPKGSVMEKPAFSELRRRALEARNQCPPPTSDTEGTIDFEVNL